MKSASLGKQYEKFAFEKFQALFRDATVKQNDRILGLQSGLYREIDVSVRFETDAESILYIIQCKDWKTPADIKVLGEFSSVIRDVNAQKGYLICTSGFAKTNRAYALSLGIELITLHDITSKKWKTVGEIPLLYIRKLVYYALNIAIRPTAELEEANRGKPLAMEITTHTLLSCDNGQSSVPYSQFIESQITSLGKQSEAHDQFTDIRTQGLKILLFGQYIPIEALQVKISRIDRSAYIKHLTPTEYSYVKDHLRGQITPLNMKLENVGLTFDSSFAPFDGDAALLNSPIVLEIEEFSML